MTDLTGQVGCVTRPGSFVARGIAAVTSSHTYHNVVHVGGGQVVSADPEGVKLRAASDWPDAIWSKFPINGLAAAKIADFARAQVGKPYAFADDALIGCERLLRIRFPYWVRRTYAEDGQWQCAELAAAALMQGGVHLWADDRERLGDWAPGDFEAYFIAQGWYPPAVFGPRVVFPW